jgi:integrase
MNNLTTVKVVFRANPQNKNIGSLHIRTTTQRKSQFKSLGIQLSLKHWDKDKECVLPSLKKEYKLFNNLINEALKKIRENNNNIQSLNTTSSTILEFWSLHNSTTRNAGTLSARGSSLNKFKSFLISNNKTGLRFEHLNPTMVQLYYLYLSNEVSKRSTKTYMGYFKSVIRQAIKQQLIPTYPVDPFININIPTPKNKTSKALTPHQLKSIIEGNFPKHNEYKDMFCFQILAGGMRVRDMLMLRWSNIMINDNGVYLQYTQSKTAKQITSKLSYKALAYLLPMMKLTHPRQVQSIENIYQQFNPQLKLYENWEHDNKYAKYKDTDTIKEFEHYDFKSGKRYRLDEIPKTEARRITLLEKITMYETDLMLEYTTLLKEYINTTPNDYIFHLLRGLIIPANGYLTPKMDRTIQKRIKVYNYHLMKISQILKMPNITSHRARHTFTQLLVNSNTNLYFIQQMLGHSSLKVTQTYVNSLHTTQLDEVSNTIASYF